MWHWVTNCHDNVFFWQNWNVCTYIVAKFVIFCFYRFWIPSTTRATRWFKRLWPTRFFANFRWIWVTKWCRWTFKVQCTLELESRENGDRGCVIKTANVPTYITNKNTGTTWKHSEYVEFLTEWSERSQYFLDPNSSKKITGVSVPVYCT